MSNPIQPPEGIGPVPVSGQKEDDALMDPAKADYKAGRDFLSKGDFTKAAMALHNALLGFEEQGDEQGVANASDRLGDVCMAREEFKMALDHYERAYAICAKEYDIFSTLALNKKRGAALRRLGELDRALEVMLDIFDHHAETRNPKGTVEILGDIAEVYLEMGERQKAADAFRTVAGIHRNFKHARMAEDFEERARRAEQG